MPQFFLAFILIVHANWMGTVRKLKHNLWKKIDPTLFHRYTINWESVLTTYAFEFGQSLIQKGILACMGMNYMSSHSFKLCKEIVGKVICKVTSESLEGNLEQEAAQSAT